jgi:hypothetical protein
VNNNDFFLAASVFDDPEWSNAIKKEFELLVTYVPKQKLPKGMAGIYHALHYVCTPRGTLERYYDFGNDVHMANPAPEKLFGTLVWDGLLRVKVNSFPEI